MLLKSKKGLLGEHSLLQSRITKLESEYQEVEITPARLIESEWQFRMLFESVPVGIGVSTYEGKMLLFNNAVPRITGYSADELRQMNISNLYADPTQREVMLERFRTKGSIQDFKVQLKCKDGSIFYCSLTVIPLAYRGEDVLLTVVKDVTEQVYAEEALRHSEEKFRMAFDNANTGMCLADLNGILLKANDKMSEIFGYGKEELEGMSVNDITHPDYKETSPEFIRKSLDGEVEGACFEKCYFHKQGHEVWGQVSSSLVRDSKGIPLYFVSQVQDITERKRIEEALKSEKERVQKYLDIAGVMFVAIDNNGFITLVNRRACEILGHIEENMVGRNWFETCIPAQIREQVRCVFERLMRCEIEPVEYFENPVITNEGKERLIAWHNTLLRDDLGQVIGTLSSGEDITERKRAEEALRESENRFRIISESTSDLIWEWDIKQVGVWFG
jgi:PAS domain S-box-containing protein